MKKTALNRPGISFALSIIEDGFGLKTVVPVIKVLRGQPKALQAFRDLESRKKKLLGYLKRELNRVHGRGRSKRDFCRLMIKVALLFKPSLKYKSKFVEKLRELQKEYATLNDNLSFGMEEFRRAEENRLNRTESSEEILETPPQPHASEGLVI